MQNSNSETSKCANSKLEIKMAIVFAENINNLVTQPSLIAPKGRRNGLLNDHRNVEVVGSDLKIMHYSYRIHVYV